MKNFKVIKKHFTRCKNPESFYKKRKKQFDNITIKESKHIKCDNFILDNIFYINLDSSVVRKNYTEQALKGAGILEYERFPAISGKDYPTLNALTSIAEGKDAQILDLAERNLSSRKFWDKEKTEKIANSLRYRNKAACIISHQKLLDLCKNKYKNWVLVFEDDFSLNYDFDTFVRKVSPLTRNNDFIVTESRIGISQQIGNGMGTAGYMINCSKIPNNFKNLYSAAPTSHYCEKSKAYKKSKLSADAKFITMFKNTDLHVCHMDNPFVQTYGLRGYQKDDYSYKASTIEVSLDNNDFNE